jgi:CHASE3 domain sensor protein
MSADQSAGNLATRKPTVLVSLFLGVFLAAGIAATTYYSAARYAEQDSLVRHTYEVKLELREVYRLLDDAETGQRGYLVTGAAEYLQPYRAAVSQVNDQLTALANLTKDNPTQEANISELRSLASAKLAELSDTVNLYQAGKTAEVRQIVLSGIGKQRMDAVRQTIGRAESGEDRLLATRISGSDKARWVEIALVAAILLITVAVYLIFLRLTQAAIKSEATLRITLSSIGDGVLATDTAGRVSYLNPVAQ